MPSNVFANNMEVSGKAASGKTICAFPDVCFTPPQTPATPPGVPIPYPNTGMASDTTDGSKNVKIGDKEVGLKDKSSFKKSMGDEAGCAPKKGVVTSKNTGKVFFNSWSMDVKIEGENAVRHLDLTTNNHASQTGDTPPWPYVDRMAMANVPGCETQRDEVNKACGENGENCTCPSPDAFRNAKDVRQTAKDAAGAAYDKDPAYIAANKNVNDEMDKFADEVKNDDCQKKLRCVLSPYDPSKCCPGQTPHHLVEAGSFYDKGRERGWQTDKKKGTTWNQKCVFGAERYDQASAPCVCCEGENQNQGTHKLMHQAQDVAARAAPAVPNPNPDFIVKTAKGEPAKFRRLDNAIDSGAEAVTEVFPEAACDPGCLKAQLEHYHYGKKPNAGLNPGMPVIAANGQGKAIPA